MVRNVQRTLSGQLSKSSSKLKKSHLNKFRISVFGLGRVGKTSIIKRFLHDTFEERHKLTIEDDYRYTFEYNNQMCDLTILDTAGSYQFPAMRKLAIDRSDAFIVVFSIDDVPSFNEARRLIKIILDLKGASNVPIVLAGNKADVTDPRVSQSEVEEAMKGMGTKFIEYLETSAKYNLNIRPVFTNAILLVENSKAQVENSSVQKSRLHNFRQSFNMNSLDRKVKTRTNSTTTIAEDPKIPQVRKKAFSQ